MYASAMGVTRFVAPGPEVAMQTPTLPVACAYPVAAWPAPCSWRTRMCRTFESYSGSYAGRIAPPGMPNATSTPSASSDRTREPAPDTWTGAATAGVAPAAGAGAAGVARWAMVSGVGLVMAIQAFGSVVLGPAGAGFLRGPAGKRGRGRSGRTCPIKTALVRMHGA